MKKKKLEAIIEELEADLEIEKGMVSSLIVAKREDRFRYENNMAKLGGDLAKSMRKQQEFFDAHNNDLAVINNLRGRIERQSLNHDDCITGESAVAWHAKKNVLVGKNEGLFDECHVLKTKNDNQFNMILEHRAKIENQRKELVSLSMSRTDTKRELNIALAQLRREEKLSDSMNEENQRAKGIAQRNISLEATINRLRSDYYDKVECDLGQAKRDLGEALRKNRELPRVREERDTAILKLETWLDSNDTYEDLMGKIVELEKQRDESVAAYQLELEAKNELQEKLDALQKGCEAVVLFYDANHWGIDRRAQWHTLTGTYEATTKSLCAFIRKCLGQTP